MKSNINIKELWNKQVVPEANHSEIVKKIKSFKRRESKKILFLNSIFLLTITFVAFVWIYFNPELLSTKIGIILTIIPILIILTLNYKLVPLYQKINEFQSNTEYLNELIRVKIKENFIQTKAMNLYFILLSVGICLYMYEYTLYRSLIFGIISYFTILLWIGINWFYLRPKIIRKNRSIIDSLIDEIRSHVNSKNE